MDHCLQKYFVGFMCFYTAKLYYISCICIGLNGLNLAKTLDFVQLSGRNLFLLYSQLHTKSWETEGVENRLLVCLEYPKKNTALHGFAVA